MTNAQIIYQAANAHGFTEDQLSQLLDAYKGDLPFHTAAEWSMRGYQVQKNAVPLFDCYLWKHTNKPSAATIKAAQEKGDEAPEQSPHFYQRLSYIYGPAQVERTPAAPNLATLKARLDALPGLTYKVKGEKTGSPNVWLSGDVDAHAETIKALGGIWSKKKSAYWIKPNMAAAPAEDKPAAPEASSAPENKTAPALCGGWQRSKVYTIRKDKGEQAPGVHRENGYTDGVFAYYKLGKCWWAVHPVYGLGICHGSSRQAAQKQAQERAAMIAAAESNPTDSMKQAAAMIAAARENDSAEYLPF